MDELQMLAKLLARPDQSDDAVEHGRRQLKEAMHDPFRKRRRTRQLTVIARPPATTPPRTSPSAAALVRSRSAADPADTPI
jgi:hypothetical protein